MSDPACLATAFLDQAPGCHWIVDARGVFRNVLGDALRIFGKSAAELLGSTVNDRLDETPARSWSGRFARALAGETVRLRESRGDAIWYVTLFPIRSGGESYAGGMAREITQYTTAERELRYTVLGALKAQEYERTKAAKFLHDTVGQNLTALGLQLDLVRMDMEHEAPEVCLRISEIQQVLESIMEQVREYSYMLNPSAVERAGLRSALDRLASRIRDRFTGAIRVNVDPSLKIDPKLAGALYGIAQEAAENAVQHASCSAIEIAVKSTRTGPFLEVRDNGKGFDPADLARGGRGLGLLSMEHYAAQAGLDLSVTSDLATGTTVRAASPSAD